MSHQLRRLFAPAAIVAAVLSPPVQASTTLDFEDPTLFPLYFDGESFSEDGFTMFVSGDAGLVDDGIGLGTAAPSGSSGYYYTQANDGWLTIARNNGGAFSLDGFSAAFVPLNPPSALATAIVAYAFFADGSDGGLAWAFAPQANGKYPFATYSTPFTDVLAVQFFTCSLVGGQVCTQPTLNNGQFALDNVQLTAAIPEPASYAMLALGLLGLGLRVRASRSVR